MQDKAKLVERIIKYWLSDKRRILGHLADDCVYVVGTGKAGSVPFYGTYRGRKRIQRFFRLHDEAQETVDCGGPPRRSYGVANDVVTVTGTSKYRLRRTGTMYESYWVLIWRFGGNRIAGLHFLFDDEVLSREFALKSSPRRER